MNHIYHLHESCFYLVRKRYREFSMGVEQTETCACALLFFLLRIPYFSSRRSVAQTGTDIFLCGFQLVTCKQEHVCLFGHICVCHHRLLLPLPSFATHRVEQAETCACALTSVYAHLSACGSSLSASTTAEHSIEDI